MNKLKSILSIKLNDFEYVTDIVSFELTSDDADSDSVTMSEYNAGTNREWTLGITAAFDGGSAGSLHDYLWNNSGASTTFLLQPKTGVTSGTTPKYTGQIRLPYRPDISIEAGTASTFDYEFTLLGQPVKLINDLPQDVFSDVYNDYL